MAVRFNMPKLNELSREHLNALIGCPNIKRFDAAMLEADSPLILHMELARSRKVFDSVELKERHGDIINVTKNTVVLSFSALDALIHSVLKRDLPEDSFKKLQYRTFQSSVQVEAALDRLSCSQGFELIASGISFDFYTEDQARKELDAYYTRKNYITHHADLDERGNAIEFSPSYAHACARFIRAFGHSFHIATFKV